MALILGIDAAWTRTAPSGVALLAVPASGPPKLLAAAPSYESFIARACGNEVDWSPSRSADVAGGTRDATDGIIKRLCIASRALAEAEAGIVAEVGIIAIDMPISRKKGPIIGRRCADNAVSSAFGAYGASVHSPTADRPGSPGRPGLLGAKLTEELCDCGFTVATADGERPERAALEVFPLAALVRLLNTDRSPQCRPKYKVAKERDYWPSVMDKNERRKQLLANWSIIRAALAQEVDGLETVLGRLPDPLPRLAPRYLKPREDALDAVICAWVGACYLRGTATPFGNAEAAIWIPTINAKA